ncbi:hypothetical protein G7Y89_g12940 [Cudoniella acicularis]|uniref:Uncharacterized protein n=1 Tax=Cudoniella acicularis TaxID=354080 RepID=A0A8H4R8A4_9HELO|nr:hypothetical protein G7Y89_g12940 [Cudoniella acicularis]
MSDLGQPIRMKFVPSIAFSVTRQRPAADRPLKAPGKNWTKALERRHLILTARRLGAMDWNRHEKNIYEKVTRWFEVIGEVLQDPAILAENVYNMDETGVMLSMPGLVKVLVGKDDKRKHRGVRVERTIVTAIECISADAVFAPLKEAYRAQVDRLERGGVNTIGKQHFTSLFSPARVTAFMPKNIKAGFATSGLFPFNPDRVLRSMPMPPAEPAPAVPRADEMTVILKDDQIQFLTTINNEAKVRRSTRPLVLAKGKGEGKVMSYEDLVEARAKRVEKDPPDPPEVEQGTADTARRGRKRKSRTPEADEVIVALHIDTGLLSTVFRPLRTLDKVIFEFDEMSQATPMRIILRYRERPFQNLKAIINAFFKWRDIQPIEDYYTHICCNPPSSQLYLVLDLYCKTYPIVDLNEIDLKVYKVSGFDSFTFQDLGEVARKQAYQRSVSLNWGEGS